uniref:MBD domain-containing protein n=1 Tax=Strigamia maritima TaxID=126957 RepID=T1IRL2_STRMM
MTFVKTVKFLNLHVLVSDQKAGSYRHLKVDETKVYKDVVDTYLGDSPLDISNGSETHSFNPNESSDDSDDDSSSPASVEAPIISPAAPLATQAPSGVTTRKKPTQPVPILPFKPRSKVERAPVPGKSGWIREQVQRQSGAIAGQWDVYFYPPGQQVKLRSRPEVRSYCENELNEPYVSAECDWKPSQKPVDTVVQEPSTEQAVVEPQQIKVTTIAHQRILMKPMPYVCIWRKFQNQTRMKRQ